MFIISHRQTSETHSFTRRELVLTNTTTSEERVIQQYHFDTWPEQGLPATSAILGLVFQVQNNQRVQEHAPVVVHCRFVCLSVCLSGGVFVWWFICLSVCFSGGVFVLLPSNVVAHPNIGIQSYDTSVYRLFSTILQLRLVRFKVISDND